MPAWGRHKAATVAANTTITTTTETVAETLPGVLADRAGLSVHVTGWAQVTAGAGTTALTARIYRGTDDTGTLVGEGNPVSVTAADTVDVFVAVDDTLQEGSDDTYALTIEQTDASGNGTILQAAMSAAWG